MNLTCLFALPADGEASLWLPEQASTVAATVDHAWWFVFWVSAIFFTLIVIAQVWFMWIYRRRAGWTEQKTAHHNFPLELTWSVIPSLIIVVMFVEGFLGFLDMRTPPADTYDISVEAKQWSWTFIYPEGVISNELHAPVNRNVKLVMSSSDVIHSLFIPAFRVKQDIVPGRYNYLWFNATKMGEYPLECTEYCGKNHSEMRTKVFIHDDKGMADWIEQQIQIVLTKPPIELGQMVYEQRGCSQCHATDQSRRVGPGFATTYGVPHEFEGGITMSAEELDSDFPNFIRESLENPQEKVRAGFPKTMPTYKGTLRPQEIYGLAAYIMSLNPKFKAEAQRKYAKPLPVEKKPGEAKAPTDQAAPAQEGSASKAPAEEKPVEAPK
jgi:cytochrome c oxidase subunit 2